jgi:hypothetical protein
MSSCCRFMIGLAISTVGGYVVIHLAILNWMRKWEDGEKHRRKAEDEPEAKQRNLSWASGTVETGLYTCALVVEAYQWIGVWLAVKVIARWQSSGHNPIPGPHTHRWLVGTGLSVLFGYLGAWFALGHPPCVK